METLKKIIRELLNDEFFIKAYRETPKDDCLNRHFRLGGYIRNKFLSQHSKTQLELINLFDTSHCDDVSSKILDVLDEIYELCISHKQLFED